MLHMGDGGHRWLGSGQCHWGQWGPNQLQWTQDRMDADKGVVLISEEYRNNRELRC